MRLASIILLCASAAAAQELRQDTTGFYPIWESTGHIEAHGDIHLGTDHAQVGLAGVAQVGIEPLGFIYRAPNVSAKFRVSSFGSWQIAAQAGVFKLLEGASSASISPAYTARIDNRGYSINLFPVLLSASVAIAPWLELHQTLTLLGIFGSGPLKNRVVPGYSLVGEANPHGRHGLSLHLAEIGFPGREFSIAGAAYRYRNGWLELRLGYFYRFTRAGDQGGPLASLGLLL